jgi:hypothetical protein
MENETISTFKKIKSDLKEMFDILTKHQDQEHHINKDMHVAQQHITNTLRKLKRNINEREYHQTQKKIF